MKYRQVETASPEEIAKRYKRSILEIAEKQRDIKSKLASRILFNPQ